MNKLERAKQKVLNLNTAQLNKRISWSKRLYAYENSDWYLGEVSTAEVGVWSRAGGLPASWTNRSLRETAHKVRLALEKNPKRLVKRARRAIPNILATNVNRLQKEKYLLPIIFKGNSGTRGRHRFKYRAKGDIDDGCMRSIALAVSGMKVIRAYIGFPKKRAVH